MWLEQWRLEATLTSGSVCCKGFYVLGAQALILNQLAGSQL
jgi:hypothetical protein